MYQGQVEAGQLLKYMSRTVLVLDPRLKEMDGFVYCLEVGETEPGMYNVAALSELEPITREENG